MLEDLHEALGRRCTPNSVTDADRTLASETIRQYGKLEMNSDVLRCKLYSILLSAYTILEATDECENLIGMILKILPLVKAEQARAGLLVTLYGCTDSSLDYERAHEIVDLTERKCSLGNKITSDSSTCMAQGDTGRLSNDPPTSYAGCFPETKPRFSISRLILSPSSWHLLRTASCGPTLGDIYCGPLIRIIKC